MDEAIKRWQRDIVTCKAKEKAGHRVSFEPHKTAFGGKVLCSCGKWKVTIQGTVYGKLDAVREFNAHAAAAVKKAARKKGIEHGTKKS